MADLAWDIVFTGPFSGTEEMQAIVFVLDHPHGCLGPWLLCNKDELG